MCTPCEQVVEQVRLTEGKAAAIAARERMEPLCDRTCACNCGCHRPVRCDQDVCGLCEQISNCA